jgi:hypothetical protein
MTQNQSLSILLITFTPQTTTNMPYLAEPELILIVVLYHMGFDPKMIAEGLGHDLRTIMRWIGRYGETGTVCTNYHLNGRLRVTSPNDDLNMVLAVMEDPFRT